jgi:SAM-dependent methyltransferase
MSEDIYKENFETWDQLAGLYQEKFMHLTHYNESYDVFLKALPKDESEIIELGCGPGNITHYLLQHQPALKILGTDISPSMIELAQKNNPKADFQVLDCRDIHRINRQFDGIVMGFCIPYVTPEDLRVLIHNCSEALNQDGVLYISFVAGPSSQSCYKTSSTGNRVYFHYYEKTELNELLMQCGFETALQMDVDYTTEDVHTIFITKKRTEHA